VAIEFVGPITVAALGSRRLRDVIALALATVGVLLLADVQWEGNRAGVLFALAAAVLWAGYIVLGHRVAARGIGLDGLAVGMVAGALAVAPIGLGPSVPAAWSATILAAALAVALLSSVIPYGLDQVLLRRLERAHFALLLALLPATATMVGLVALRQVPAPAELVGIALVIAAVAARTPEPAAGTAP
jgi:inner membrane transporter RhtA